MVACVPPDVLAFDQYSDNNRIQQTHSASDRFQVCLDLRDILRDKERWQILLQDRDRIHDMLQQRELRQEMLQQPRFMRQMMQISELRRELLRNEQMMHEMLQNRDINREINRNRKMMEEIEKNETYRRINQDQQAEILEGLLLESTASGGSSHPP